MNNNIPHNTTETKNRSSTELNGDKSLVPLVLICSGILLFLLICFYVFLMIHNKFTYAYTVNEDGASCTVTSVGERTFAPFIYYPSTLKIPEHIDGLKVSAIAPDAAKGFSKIKKLSVPESVTEIGAEAFASCTALKSAILPNGLLSLGEGAFKDCVSLEAINLGSGITLIEKSTFEGCAKLASVALPESLTGIGARAFYGCVGMEQISLPGTLAEIGEEAFWGCSSLASLTLPESTKTIGKYSFWGCTSLKSADLGSVELIGASAFCKCTALATVNVPESVVLLEDKTFAGCESLESLGLPKGIRSLGGRNFENCKKLASINYGGTQESWKNVALDMNWKINSSVAKIVCSDGEINV